MHYPPFAFLTNVLITGESLEETAAWAATLGRWISSARLEGVRVLGPATAPIPRIKRIYRFHLLLKAQRRDVLGRVLRELLAHAEQQGIPRRNLMVDVDPLHLM